MLEKWAKHKGLSSTREYELNIKFRLCGGRMVKPESLDFKLGISGQMQQDLDF